eukprot:scaffold104031_cov33-Tisochrysis_lutea.AAC.3
MAQIESVPYSTEHDLNRKKKTEKERPSRQSSLVTITSGESRGARAAPASFSVPPSLPLLLSLAP